MAGPCDPEQRTPHLSEILGTGNKLGLTSELILAIVR